MRKMLRLRVAALLPRLSERERESVCFCFLMSFRSVFLSCSVFLEHIHVRGLCMCVCN